VAAVASGLQKNELFYAGNGDLTGARVQITGACFRVMVISIISWCNETQWLMQIVVCCPSELNVFRNLQTVTPAALSST